MDLSCSERDVISLYSVCCSVNGSVCLVCLTVFVNCLVKQFAMCLGVVAILLLYVMDLFSVGKVLCWIARVWASKECACCASDPGIHLSVPSICLFVFLYVGSYPLI